MIPHTEACPEIAESSCDEVSSSGYCSDCGTVHSLTSGKATPYCYALMEQLEQHQRFDFDVSAEEANPLLSTHSLYSEMRGKMIGVLVCEDKHGNEIILRAFSARYNGLWDAPGWVSPLFDVNKFNAEIEHGNTGIHPLTDLIATLEKRSAEWNAKVAERKSVSHKVLSKLYALYEVHNFRNEKRSLQDAFDNKTIPAGTGDCCAPKLLNHAAKNGLKPISIAEFFWGKETLSGHRTQGEFYSSCEEKCRPLLGFMLCGLHQQNDL